MKKLFRLLRYDWPLHFLLLVTNWLPDNVIILRLRGVIIRPFFKSCGSNLRVGRNLVFYNPSKIAFGSNVYIAYGSWLAASGSICVGDEVMFGPYVVVTDGNHTRIDGSFRYGEPERLHITISRGSWIGAHSIILGGVSIGKGSVVGSGATVIRGEYPDNSFLVGVPAKVKKLIGETIH